MLKHKSDVRFGVELGGLLCLNAWIELAVHTIIQSVAWKVPAAQNKVALRAAILWVPDKLELASR